MGVAWFDGIKLATFSMFDGRVASGNYTGFSSLIVPYPASSFTTGDNIFVGSPSGRDTLELYNGKILKLAFITSKDSSSSHSNGSYQILNAGDDATIDIWWTNIAPRPPSRESGRRRVIQRGRGTSRGRKLITTSPVNWEDGKITTEKLTRFEQWIESAFQQLSGRTAQQFEFISITTGTDSVAQFQRTGRGKILSFTVFDKLTGGATLATAIISTTKDQDTGWFKGLKEREYLVTIIGE